MHKINRLLMIQLQQLPFIAELKTATRKRKLIIYASFVGYFFFALSFAFQMLSIVFFLITIGFSADIPVFIVSITSIILFSFVLIRSKNMLFGANDWQLLAPLPLPTWQIVSSKIIFFYLSLLSITVVFSVPSAILLFIFIPETTPLLFFIIPVIPFIPIFFGSMLTLILSKWTQRFKHSAILSILGSLFVIGFVGITIATSFSSNLANDLTFYYTNLIGLTKLYLPSLLLLGIFTSTVWGYISFFVLSSFTLFVLVIVVTKYYQQMNTYLSMHANSSISKKRQQRQQRSPLKALIAKEFTYFFQSSTAMINIGFGLLIVILLSLWMLSFDNVNTPEFILGINPYILIPYVICYMLGSSNYASVMLSLEGNQLWIIQTLPLSWRTIITSKVSTNLILQCVPLILFAICLLIKNILPLSETILSLILLFSWAIFLSFFGLLINFFFPKYDWRNEKSPLKNSLALYVTMISSMFITTFFVFLIMYFYQYSNMIMIFQICLLNIVSYVIFSWLQRQRLYQ